MRISNIAAGILLVVRVYLGWLWLSARWGKVTSGFNAGGFLGGAVANPVMKDGEPVFGWYVSFLENFALPNADLFSFLVLRLEKVISCPLYPISTANNH